LSTHTFIKNAALFPVRLLRAYKSLLVILFSLFVGNGLHAQIIEDKSTWTFEAKKKSGSEYEIIVHVKIPEHFHIWSMKPGGDGSLVPPSFKFSKNDKVTVKGTPKEKGKLISGPIKGLEDILGSVNMYKESVDFLISATITGNTKVAGTYKYQICNDELCLAPVTKPFSINITDAGGSMDTSSVLVSTLTPADSQTAIGGNKKDGTVNDDTAQGKMAAQAPPSGDNGNDKKEMSLLLLFFISLGAGFAALLTPCVYSMIPITVSFFTKRSKTKQEGIKNAIYYALSIIIIFTLLGVLLSLAFGPTALYKLSTNWIANLFFFAMFVVFGISFLGAFEISLPSSWTSKTDSKAGMGSFSGIFFMALTLVIVSFSCTGPIIGPLVVVAGNGGIAGPAIGMFGFSLGLSLPFALFAVFPGMLNKMATSGGWLNQVKVTLGFIELAFAMKFLSNADLVKH